jgi:hypothetical protein
MSNKRAALVVLPSLLFACAGLLPSAAPAQDAPQVKLPDPGVPEAFSIEGKFIRAAYNNEGYVILGYQPANRSIGNEWMLLDVGMTVLGKTPNYTLTRAAISVETPDGKTIPLATSAEQRAGGTQAAERRANMQRDSINYFPRVANQPCRIGFFSELSSPAMPFDEVELSPVRACVGRLFFHVPGGIAYGQHWLNVKFEGSLIRVPFRILTKDEEKFLGKNMKSIRQQVDEAFDPKG